MAGLTQKADINFAGSAKITGLPVSTADGQPVVHEQIVALTGMIIDKGGWNASTNTPTIPTAAASNRGWFYTVTTAGTTSIGGITDWEPGDNVRSDGTAWYKVDNSSAANSAASATVSGIVELATDAEAKTGTDTARAVTPANIKAVLDATKYVETFGGAASSVITHNLDSDDVVAVVREVATKKIVGVDIEYTSVNTVTVTFAAATAANSHRIVVTK